MADASRSLPLPPVALRERVGATHSAWPAHERQLRRAAWWDPDPERAWLAQGRHLAGLIRAHLPAGVDLRGARVLDFGCGAGRVLRHLVEDVGPAGELHGVDIHAESITWLRDHTGDAFHVDLVDERPGLPHPDAVFDVVYAMSVFTHLTEDWAGWLLEMRRVLAPGGVLLATVIGDATAAELGLGLPGTEVEGMCVRALGNSWDVGGPVVVHGRDWVADRWGRAFELLAHVPRATGVPWPHDIVVARPRPGSVTVADLLLPGPDSGAEGRAQAVQRQALRADALIRRMDLEARAAAVVAAQSARRTAIDAQAGELLAGLADRHAAMEAEAADAADSAVSAPPGAR